MDSAYPSQYQLHEVTAHVVALLERRRAAFEVWDEAGQAALTEAAKQALAEAGVRFREVADDEAFWARTTAAVLEVALPRYFKLAKEQHALEQRGYGAWRGGDFLSRAAYAGVGLVLGFVILRTPIPNWLEPIPLALFIGGPLIPDAQAWFAKRRYAKQLLSMLDDMKAEASARRAYQPLGIDEGVAAPGESLPARQDVDSTKG